MCLDLDPVQIGSGKLTRLSASGRMTRYSDIEPEFLNSASRPGRVDLGARLRMIALGIEPQTGWISVFSRVTSRRIRGTVLTKESAMLNWLLLWWRRFRAWMMPEPAVPRITTRYRNRTNLQISTLVIIARIAQIAAQGLITTRKRFSRRSSSRGLAGDGTETPNSRQWTRKLPRKSGSWNQGSVYAPPGSNGCAGPDEDSGTKVSGKVPAFGYTGTTPLVSVRSMAIAY